MLERKNYKINSQIDFGGETINGQGVGKISFCRYGFFSAGYNACEMIAIYNLLLRSGYEGHAFADICLEMYPKTWAFWGIFGSNVYTLYLYFKNHGIPYRRYYKLESFQAALEHTGCGMLSFWNADNPLKGIHTVCVEKTADGYRVYNKRNRLTTPFDCKSFSEITIPRRFLSGFTIAKNNP